MPFTTPQCFQKFSTVYLNVVRKYYLAPIDQEIKLPYVVNLSTFLILQKYSLEEKFSCFAQWDGKTVYTNSHDEIHLLQCYILWEIVYLLVYLLGIFATSSKKLLSHSYM
jgi:hypothetical protein